jgi:archaellum component FlaC
MQMGISGMQKDVAGMQEQLKGMAREVHEVKSRVEILADINHPPSAG